MNIEKMREEFRIWFAETYPKINREETSQDCLFKMIASQAWEESRAAIEVELPERLNEGWQDGDPMEVHQNGDFMRSDDVIQAIESLGLKVKS